MSLESWAEAGWLKPHTSSRREIADLLGAVDRDLATSQIENLITDWKLIIAYKAALHSATIALAASGYRVSRERYHYLTVQSLAYTIGLDQDTVNLLDAIRMKRAISDYERAGTVSDSEAGEAFSLARAVREKVETWLREHHPDLIQ